MITKDDEECYMIERWNRTIKTHLWCYFSANGTEKYINILQPLINKYNSTKYPTFMEPLDARHPSNHEKVFKNLHFKKVQT